MPTEATPSEAIWMPPARAPAVAVYTRHEFFVRDEPTDAWIRCAASAPFALRLNGEHLGFGQGPTLAPAPVWERFELAPLLRRGANMVVVFVAGTHREPQPWVRIHGIVAYADGSREELATGPLWTITPATTWLPLHSPPFTVAYMATEAPPEWERGRSSQAAWDAPSPVDAPAPRPWNPRAAAEVEVFAPALIKYGETEVAAPLELPGRTTPMRTCKCVRRESILRPGRQQALVQTRNPERAVLLLLDFGRVLTGYPRLRLQGAAGGVIDLAFSTQLETINAAVRYVAGDGSQQWTAHQPERCRYVLVRLYNWPEPMELDCVSLVERRVQVPTRNDFSAPTLWSALWETGQASLEDDRREIYSTSPDPTSPSWLVAAAHMLNGFALFGDYQTAAAMLACSPVPTPDPETPEEALAYVLCLESYYRHSGDLEPVRSCLDELAGLLEAFQRLTDASGLFQPRDLRTTTAVNVLYEGMLKAASQLARAAGVKQLANQWSTVGAAVRRALQQSWHPEAGLYADQPGATPPTFSQWTNGLALRFHAGKADRNAEIAARLRDAHVIRVRDSLEAFYLADGLFHADADRQALEVIEQQWGTRLQRHGSTWQEKWGSAPKRSAVGAEYFLASRVLGVQPARPGYSVLLIRPVVTGLPEASGQLLTRRGPVTVTWTCEELNGRYSLQVSAPDGGDIHLAAPRQQLRFPTIELNGETLWRNEKVYPNELVREVIAQPERVTLVLHQGGSYRLTVD